MPKKRMIWVGILLVICLAGQWLLRLGLAAGESADSQISSPLNEPSGESSQSKTQNPDILHRQLVRQLISMILLIALFGAGLWWLARRYSKGLMTGKGKLISMTETIPLGPRKMVHVLQAGSRKLLLSSTPDSIRFLADITDAFEPPASANEIQKGDRQ